MITCPSCGWYPCQCAPPAPAPAAKCSGCGKDGVSRAADQACSVCCDVCRIRGECGYHPSAPAPDLAAEKKWFQDLDPAEMHEKSNVLPPAAETGTRRCLHGLLMGSDHCTISYPSKEAYNISRALWEQVIGRVKSDTDAINLIARLVLAERAFLESALATECAALKEAREEIESAKREYMRFFTLNASRTLPDLMAEVVGCANEHWERIKTYRQEINALRAALTASAGEERAK